MTEKEYQKFITRYDKFKNNNLPTPFWDEERNTEEYVWFKDNKLETEDNIIYALSEVTFSGLYYPFIDKHYKGTSDKLISVIGHNHAHSFDEVLKALYYSPESFRIEESDKKYYSTQELQYINDIQKYLLFIDLKDYDEKEKKRFQNKKHAKYTNCPRITLKQKEIDRIKNNEIDFIAFKYQECYTSFKPYKALIINENGDYCLHVLIKNRKKVKYKEIKDKYIFNNYDDNNYIELDYIEILEILK